MYTASTSPQPLNVVSTEKMAAFGTMYEDEVGRVFRYCRNGAVALTMGQVCQMAAAQANTWGRTLAAPKRNSDSWLGGGASVNVVVATAPTENQWVDGLLAFGLAANGASGIVAGHETIASSGTDFTLTSPPPRNATPPVGSVRSGVVVSPYNGVVATETDMTRPPVCVAQWPVPANYYFWGLVRGIGVASVQGTIVVGDAVACSVSTAGAVTPYILTVPAGTDAAGGTLTPAQQVPIGWAATAAGIYTGVGAVIFNLA